MPSKEELHSTFSNFPSEDHIENICKRGQGAETCRYLVFKGRGFSCEKAGFIRDALDERFEGDAMGAKGDNCDGTLGFVQENQSLLLGNKTIYEELSPTKREEATFEGLVTNNEWVHLLTSGENSLSINEEFVQIDISPTGLVFSPRGLGAYVGKLQILFEKP